MKSRLTLLVALLALAVIIAFVHAEYVAPVIIQERSGHNLYNYTVKIELNSTNFPYWSYILYDNGSDIYFTLANGTPLYYWIEYFNKTEQKAIIWVKVPYIPANGTTIIYMYFGGLNPYIEYNNPKRTFVLYDHLTSITGWTAVKTSDPDGNGAISISQVNGTILKITYSDGGGSYGTWGYVSKNYAIPMSMRFKITFYFMVDDAPRRYHDFALGVVILATDGHTYSVCVDFTARENPGVPPADHTVYVDSHATLTAGVWYKIELDPIEILSSKGYNIVPQKLKTIYFGVEIYGDTDNAYVDWIIVRYYVDPEPTVSIGHPHLVRAVKLPSTSLYLTHIIVYSPNSTQFVHSFTATNTSVAGYETGYGDAWGWRVYAEPSSGSENTAVLVSKVNITLPYASVIVRNVTLLARTNGTGSLRQLWIKILDSNGNVVAEITNATIGTSWTEVVLPVNANLSGQITIWINATVKSTTTTGEELAVKDVRVYVEYSTNPIVAVSLAPNVEYFNCTASHLVELGSTEYLNYSAILLKVIEYLLLNSTNYPVEPVYIGNETIGSHVYKVYRIEPANYSQYLTIRLLLRNVLVGFKVHVRGVVTSIVLVKEPLTVELPEIANVTIPELNETFLNVTELILRFNKTGTYTIVVNTTLPSLWKIGLVAKTITVKYGAFMVKPFDKDSRLVNYVDLTFLLVNTTTGAVIKAVEGRGNITLSDLWAGTYSVIVKFKDIVVCSKLFELNVTTDGSALELNCSIKALPSDYRGINRTIVYPHGVQLLDVKSMSAKFPYSRMMLVLNGTGPFKLYIDYGRRPTKVSVTGNVSGLTYYWDGNYLVVEGSLGSVGVLNITDLYKLSIEARDRLGRLLPTLELKVNNTVLRGAIAVTYLPPGRYNVTAPVEYSGFKFYAWGSGINVTTVNVTVNTSDVKMIVYYRTPTKFVETGSYKIARTWWFIPLLPFLSQEGDYMDVYIEGYLKDYFGAGVPGRTVTVRIIDTEADTAFTFNVTTDASGYFKTPILHLIPNRTYVIVLSYTGDDIYVGTNMTLKITPMSLPEQPTPAPGTVIVPLPALIGVVLSVVGIMASLKALSMLRKQRRFVKKRRR